MPELAKKVLARLRQERGEAPPPESPDPLSAGEVAAMPLDRFARARLTLEVDSPLLGQHVWFVSGEAEAHVLLERGIPRQDIYTTEELLILLDIPGMNEVKMRRIHEAKEMFSGVIRQGEAS